MRLATSLALALDPVRLARAAGVHPDPWQSDLLRSPARQILMLCSRQSGKSTVAALLAVDEAARVRDSLYQAVRPMLAVSGGRIVALSSAWGRRGWFHGEYTEGGPDWHCVKVTARERARIDPEWLEAERRRIPALVFQSEYECIFTNTEDAVFQYEHVMAALSDDVQPLFPPRAA